MFEDTWEPAVTDKMTGDVIDSQDSGSAHKSADIPSDLYIPQHALEIITNSFEGPLDLLLYLIRKNRFNVLDIPVAKVAQQYAEYVEVMQKIQLELAGEYLAMAATLAQIKSRLLLPAKESEAKEEEEVDPRQELARRLQIYEKFRITAKLLDSHPRVGRDVFASHVRSVADRPPPRFRKVPIEELVKSFKQVVAATSELSVVEVHKEPLSVNEKTESIHEMLRSVKTIQFIDLFDSSEGKAGIVVAFLAILELIGSGKIYAYQPEAEAPIHLHLKE